MRPHPSRRERPLIELFLTAYDDGAYRGCVLDWLEDREDGAVEVLATSATGQTLAIEHTLIEPFAGEKRDSHRFVQAFSRVEHDEALIVPERDVEICIPVDALPNGVDWNEVGEDLRTWIADHQQSLQEGISQHACITARCSKRGPISLEIVVSVTCMPGTPGRCRVARYCVPETLTEGVARALRAKLPKLVNTRADTRVLLLERDQWFPSVLKIFSLIVDLCDTFPEMKQVDAIWFANTAGLATEDYVGFYLVDRRGVAAILNFKGGLLTSKRDDRGLTPDDHV